jgi:hypothetical protein
MIPGTFKSQVKVEDPLICFKKSTLVRSGISFVLISILLIFIYHKYQKSKCETFCIYKEDFSNIKNKKRL